MLTLLDMGFRRGAPTGARRQRDDEATKPRAKKRACLQTRLVAVDLPPREGRRATIAEAPGAAPEMYDVARFSAFAAGHEARRSPLVRYEVVARMGPFKPFFHVVAEDDEALAAAGRAALQVCGGTRTVTLRCGRRGVRIVVADAEYTGSLAAAARKLRALWPPSAGGGTVLDLPHAAAGVFGAADDDSPLYVVAPWCRGEAPASGKAGSFVAPVAFVPSGACAGPSDPFVSCCAFF